MNKIFFIYLGFYLAINNGHATCHLESLPNEGPDYVCTPTLLIPTSIPRLVRVDIFLEAGIATAISKSGGRNSKERVEFLCQIGKDEKNIWYHDYTRKESTVLFTQTPEISAIYSCYDPNSYFFSCREVE